MKPIAYLAVFDTLADWEPGYLLAEMRTGRFTGIEWDVVTVAEGPEPVTTMGGVRIAPDARLDDIDPRDGDLLILPGGENWDAGEGAAWVEAARSCLSDSTPVAAICGATGALAEAGLLDFRRHTSSAPDYLAAFPGYAGQEYYRDLRAVSDAGLVTAGPQSPVHFAVETLRYLELAPESVLDAYLGLFHDADPAAFPTLMQAAARES